MTSLDEWIDLKIKDDDINYFEPDDFNNLEKVGEGAFGIINRADWKSGRIKIALKILANNSSINEDNMNKFLEELKNLRKVSFHPNINQFFGVTKDPLSNNYIMVLQYANQGNLREYLENNFDSLRWDDKIQMAFDIVCGLKCLHSKEIIHKNLHSRNILVHNKKLMIADLGLSKQLTEVISYSKVYGMPAYIEPQCYKINNYVRDKKSDIYSLGVLLWEITSRQPPFYNTSHLTLICQIGNMGLREKPVQNTPLEYQQLYQKCWDDNPYLRPNIDTVFVKLEQIFFDSSKLDINSNLINKDNSQSQSLNLTNSNNISELKIENQISTYEIELRNVLDEITQAYLKINDIGWTKSFEFDNVLNKYRSKSREIFNYLINNPTIRHYELMIGNFYANKFGIDKNKNIAFDWYMKACQQNDIHGLSEVGKCYLYGNGIGKDHKKAFEFFQLAANNGLNIALFYIAYCYEKGYGIQKNCFNAFEFYKKSDENGFMPSQYFLARCYQSGEGTQKNQIEALKWFKKYQESVGRVDVSCYIREIEKELEQ